MEEANRSTSDAWNTYLSNRLDPIVHVATHRSTDASEVTRARLAGFAELEEAHKSAQRIRTTINALSPMCRLPTEILAHIFVLLSDIYHPTSQPDHDHNFPARKYLRSTNVEVTKLGWVYILHVCRLWREVALEYSPLWTGVEVILGPAWAQLFLKNSRSHPVAIARPPSRSNLSLHSYVYEAIDYVIHHAPQRLTNLDICNESCFYLYGDEVTSILSMMRARSLPQLQELHLSSPTPIDGPLPAEIFTSVKHMSITSTMIGEGTAWDTFPCTFRSIRILQQSSITVLPAQAALDGLFSFLGRCSELTKLEIKNPVLDYMPIGGGIHLPSLQSLSLHGGSTSIFPFLDEILSVPAIRHLKLGFSSFGYGELDAITSTIHKEELQLGTIPCDDLSILHRPGHLQFEIDVLGASQPRTAKSAVSLMFPDASMSAQLTNVLIYPMNLSEVRRLHVRGLLAAPSLWKRWFGEARDVRQLTLEDTDTFACVRALGLHSLKPSLNPPNLLGYSRPPEDMLFPSLHELCIRDADFTKVIAPALTPGHAAAVMKLSLSTRAHWRCAPRCLKLHNCTVSERELEGWANVVPPEQRDWTPDSLTRSCS